MSVNKPQGPSANEYDPLALLGITDPKREAKASDLDNLPGGPAKSSEELPSFGELGKKGVAFGKPSEPGASGQIAMDKGVGVTTANPEFNRSPGARAALAHGGLLTMSKSQPGRLAWSPKLGGQADTGHIPEDRKAIAYVSSGEGSPKGPRAAAIHSPMSFGVHAFDGQRPPAFRSAPLTGLLEYTKPEGRGVLFPYDPV